MKVFLAILLAGSLLNVIFLFDVAWCKRGAVWW
jgi:hypothetical protein